MNIKSLALGIGLALGAFGLSICASPPAVADTVNPLSLPSATFNLQTCSFGQCISGDQGTITPNSNGPNQDNYQLSGNGGTATGGYSLCCSIDAMATASPSGSGSIVSSVTQLTYQMEILSTNHTQDSLTVAALGSVNFTGGSIPGETDTAYGTWIHFDTTGINMFCHADTCSGLSINMTELLPTNVPITVNIEASAVADSISSLNIFQTSSATMDPYFSFAAGFDPDGDTLIFSPGIINTPAVPEPSTWAMMILGFLGLGFMAYRRKSSSRFRFT
ncbi:PEP-CTERM sorting domain-containing protein [Bradyrhizobium genosp. P]|uniref:PEP-CTERM sorting domain-containing protein n=1 Tax=Bradyrhizobium genosp. P TaxID=83641 RepID=UPI003CF78EA6